MIQKIKALRNNMAFNITAVIVLILAAFAIVVSVVGILKFLDAFDAEYSNTTYHIADTAASLVNGDHIEEYLAGEQTEEYARTRRILNAYCNRMNVSLVYRVTMRALSLFSMPLIILWTIPITRSGSSGIRVRPQTMSTGKHTEKYMKMSLRSRSYTVLIRGRVCARISL